MSKIPPPINIPQNANNLHIIIYIVTTALRIAASASRHSAAAAGTIPAMTADKLRRQLLARTLAAPGGKHFALSRTVRQRPRRNCTESEMT